MRSNSQQPDVKVVVQEAEALLGGPDIFRGEEIFFPTRKRTTLLRVKSTKAVLPVLKHALEPEEKVRFISARGYTYYVWEQFFGAGVWANYVNGTTLVLTDRRLLAFNVKYRSRMPKDIKNAMPLSEITSVRRFGSGLTFRLRDGRKLRVTGLPFADARELRARLKKQLEDPAHQIAGVRADTRSVQHLCPVCCRPIESVDSLQCPSCRTAFRSGRTAALRSLLLPGLGDIYLKHTVLGVLELFGSVIVWLIVLAALLSREADAIIMAVFLFVAVNVVDYFVTKAMARKGVIAK